MFNRIIMLVLLAPITLFAPAGCDGEKDCVALCEAGQDGNCTSIEGSCAEFCGALDSIQDAAGCTDERESYEACLNEDDDVCSASCSSEENSLGSCIATHCAADPSNSDCQQLASQLL